MKLSSPRIWLVVAASVLVLAGVGVVYVVKNPPLPQGWKEYDCELFRVALPPGNEAIPKPFSIEDVINRNLYVVRHTSHSGGSIEAYGVDSNRWGMQVIPDKTLDNSVASLSLSRDWESIKVESIEQIQHRGYPGRILTLEDTTRGRVPMRTKFLIVYVKGWIHTVSVSNEPGAFVEADADFLFRSFRPK